MDRKNLKYYWELEQCSEEWEQLRLGKFTGTDADTLLTNGKDADGLGVGVRTKIYAKCAELIVGKEDEFAGNAHTDRGNQVEPLAIVAYEEKNWETVRKCGFVELFHYAGFSPDGLVGEDGLIEVKSLCGKEHLRIILERDIDKKYLAQMQWGLWVSGRQWCDNVYFNPMFPPDKRLEIIRVERDPELMKLFETKMETIQKRMDAILNQFK